ncbi:hypothetical protein JWG45_02780 [Leptospira sp. 201903070]|uniref:Uncharacterized protein n=1 Tax=Leptospira ainlahdjerensis TaxID=2810033 RepID=A0ABS2U950_9LEPT|nr:hypothetical protein [Leptospira ainlahdjerensis]MBM9576068.1 hypothetical protein [Leptospira ainlahdjerensis]
MHSHITVIIPNFTNNIYAELKRIIEPHRLDDDDIKSIRSRHFDAWYFPSDPLIDQELKTNYPKDHEEILNHSCYVRNLPEIYHTSGVILPNGSWIDLQDFGWRLLHEPSQKNESAWKQWLKKFQQLIDVHKEQICTQIIVHS